MQIPPIVYSKTRAKSRHITAVQRPEQGLRCSALSYLFTVVHQYWDQALSGGRTRRTNLLFQLRSTTKHVSGQSPLMESSTVSLKVLSLN